MTDADRQRIRVLLADDDRPFVGALRALIDGQPELEVVGAGYNGLEAIEQADELDPGADGVLLKSELVDGLVERLANLQMTA